MEMMKSAASEHAIAVDADGHDQPNAAAGQEFAQDQKQSEAVKKTLSQDLTMPDTTEEQPLTHALEALLGGLESPAPAVEPNPIVSETPTAEDDQMLSPAPRMESTPNSLPHPAIPGLFLEAENLAAAPNFVNDALTSESSVTAIVTASTTEVASIQDGSPVSAETISVPIAGSPRSIRENISVAEDALTKDGAPAPVELNEEMVPEKDALAAAEDMLLAEIPATEEVPASEDALEEGEHPEWELDSSPIESSSSSSSDDSSSDESEEGENSYKLLTPAEQARILMEGEGGSDDEGGGKAKAAATQLRTKNEVTEVVVPKPDVTITLAMPIVEVGNVEHIVESTLVIRAKTSGEFRCLESGSVLCLEDRSVIGAVSEILGPVQKPLYSVMFTNAEDIAAAGLSLGTKIFYSEQHSTFVFTQALKAFKGSDASNLHDEEVGEEEIEFSDDEAEAEHKRRVKQKKNEKRGGRIQQNGSRGGGHPLQQQHAPHDATQGINYDDAEDDGPYRPLARPAGFENSIGLGRGEAPQESAPGTYVRPNRDQFRGRGRGGDRLRGDRPRGSGDRGRGRDGYPDRRGGQSQGPSLPPRPQGFITQPSAPFQSPRYQPPTQGRDFSQATPTVPNFFMPQGAYPLAQPQMPWPQFSHPPFPPPNHDRQSPRQNPAAPPQQGAPPGGAYLNPAFWPGQWNSQNGGGPGV
ncbi:snoRNP assembly factor Naf1 [Diplocarpon rosae]|nr:snoRNP assembly factor Naf1 [Diplocarpon rosae]